jgi:hypothetical protein
MLHFGQLLPSMLVLGYTGNMQGANTPAYFDTAAVTEKKRFLRSAQVYFFPKNCI